MDVINPILAVYALASCGYALRSLMINAFAGRTARHLLFFLLWNTIAAVALSFLLRLWMTRYGSGAAILTLTLVSITPHLVILAGNIGNCVGAVRAGCDRSITILLGSWLVVSVFLITLLGAISPVTYLLNVLFRA
jgi:hypothetical protein